MDTTTRVQILDKTVCISHSTNTLGKGMNPIILPPAKHQSPNSFIQQFQIKSMQKIKTIHFQIIFTLHTLA